MTSALFSHGLSDIGLVRAGNEDSMFFSDGPVGCLPNLYVVADGMGGHNAGEIASREAVRFFIERIESASSKADDYLDTLVGGVSYANSRVYGMSLSQQPLRGMGTTFSACVIADKKIYIAHVGDSRVYMSDGYEMTQLTADHTYVSEMVRAGALTPRQAMTHEKRGMLTRALGTSAEIQIDALARELPGECVILLCSDGLTNMLPDARIHKILLGGADAAAAAAELIGEANNNGGSDNVTAIVIQSRFDEGGVSV